MDQEVQCKAKGYFTAKCKLKMLLFLNFPNLSDLKLKCYLKAAIISLSGQKHSC